MKRLIAILLLFIFAVTGCNPKADEPDNPFSDWLTTARLEAEETPDELYAAALGEDILIVYSNSSRVFDVAKTFEAAYPGLTVIIRDIRGADIIQKLNDNFQNGDFDCDVVICSDSDGIISQDLMKRGILHKYVPHDIKDRLLPGNDTETLQFVGEAEMVFFNSNAFETPPINNWWELTEETWKGRVYMPSPFRSLSNIALMSMIVKNSDFMEAAYIERYGYAPDLSRDENAGKLFIRLLYENGVNLTNTGDECVEFLNKSTTQEPALAIMISSKLRMRETGYAIQAIPDITPFSGAYTPNSVSIAGGARNINAAKLFIRWLLGEADGQGVGYIPYLQSGAWPVREDVQDGSDLTISEMRFLYLDTEYIYESNEDILAYLAELIGKN